MVNGCHLTQPRFLVIPPSDPAGLACSTAVTKQDATARERLSTSLSRHLHRLPLPTLPTLPRRSATARSISSETAYFTIPNLSLAINNHLAADRQNVCGAL
jgi:hypothetical protein